MTFIRFKVHCNHSASEDVEMDLVEDDMAWVFECPKCGNKKACRDLANMLASKGGN